MLLKKLSILSLVGAVIELKVTRRNSITFSPHQIAFHSRHPHNSFILAKALDPWSMKLVPGSMIQELLREGFACASDHDTWSTILARLSAC